MRDFKGAVQWYRDNQTTSQIGFNPDGMCLKVCRTARDIPSMYPSAKAAQDATPQEHRVHRIADLRKGMVLYFDDPNDSNTFGHIVTMIGRVRGADLDSLHDIIVETNSVKSGELVKVRADYFVNWWGDTFQFGATWLNGQELDVHVPKVVGANRIENFRESRPEWDVKILDRVADQGRRDIRRLVRQIEEAVAALPDDRKDTRVKEFKELFAKRRVLKLVLLNKAVEDGRMSLVKEQRNKLRAIIKKIIL